MRFLLYFDIRLRLGLGVPGAKKCPNNFSNGRSICNAITNNPSPPIAPLPSDSHILDTFTTSFDKWQEAVRAHRCT